MIYNLHQYFFNVQKIFTPSRKKKAMETRIIKTIPMKMKEDVGMSKPKKHANKVRWDPKLNKPLPYNPT